MQHLTPQCEQWFKENLEKWKTNTHNLAENKSSISSKKISENGIENNDLERKNSIVDINHINIFHECTSDYLSAFLWTRDRSCFIQELLDKNLIWLRIETQYIHDEYINEYCHKNDPIHEMVTADFCFSTRPCPIKYTYFYLTGDGFNYFENLSKEEKIKKTKRSFSLTQIFLCGISLVFVIAAFAVAIISLYK